MFIILIISVKELQYVYIIIYNYILYYKILKYIIIIFYY